MTQQLLQQIFTYRDGFLYWKGTYCTRLNNTPAGTIDKIKGYRHIRYKGKSYLSSRLIFLFHHGYLPRTVDHRDRNKLNDKIENLRAATIHENNQNKGKYSKQTSSKYKGVTFNKARLKWKAKIGINGVQKHLGTFDTEKEAAIAYNNAALLHYKEFAYLNKIN